MRCSLVRGNKIIKSQYDDAIIQILAESQLLNPAGQLRDTAIANEMTDLPGLGSLKSKTLTPHMRLP